MALRYLRKINRGMVVSLILLIALVISQMSAGAFQRRSEPELEALAKRYAQAELPFLMLPPRLLPEDGKAPTPEALDAFAREAEQALAPFFERDPEALKHTLRRLRARWYAQRYAWPSGQATIEHWRRKQLVFTGDTALMSYAATLPAGQKAPVNQPHDDASPSGDPSVDSWIGFRLIDGHWSIAFAIQQRDAYSGLMYRSYY